MNAPMIWVVSPDPDTRRLIGLNLDKRGFGVLETCSQNGLVSLGVEPQLIILDMDTTDEPGCRAVSALRSSPGLQRVPLILLLPAAPATRRLVPLQPVRWLEKPLEMDALLVLVWESLACQGEEDAVVTAGTLAEAPLFEGLPDNVLASIAALCRTESYPSGAIICAEGRRAGRIYLLQDGKVGLLVHPTSLPKPLTTSVLKSSGQAFGWSAVVGKSYYTARVQALSHVHVISIDGRKLLGYLEQNPAAGFVVMKRVAEIVSGRLRIMRTLVLETAFDLNTQ